MRFEQKMTSDNASRGNSSAGNRDLAIIKQHKIIYFAINFLLFFTCYCFLLTDISSWACGWLWPFIRERDTNIRANCCCVSASCGCVFCYVLLHGTSHDTNNLLSPRFLRKITSLTIPLCTCFLFISIFVGWRRIFSKNRYRHHYYCSFFPPGL